MDTFEWDRLFGAGNYWTLFCGVSVSMLCDTALQRRHSGFLVQSEA